MTETLFLQLQRFISSQGSICKRRELRAMREGESSMLWACNTKGNLFGLRNWHGGGSQRRWRFQHRVRQREEFQAAETAKAWAQKCAKSMGNDLVWWHTCHGWKGGSLVDWVIPHRVSDVLLGFGNVSSGYEKHGRNFVWLFMCGWACFSKLFY